MNRGRLITFEGIDGSGKSTQLARTAEWLGEHGVPVCVTREPGDTPLGAELRRLLLNGEFVPVAEAELFLFLADRAQHVRQLIEPALAGGSWVLCDRYSDSTLAYQLAARELGTSDGRMEPMLEFAECGVRPDLTLWFDLPVEVALQRMRQRNMMGEKSSRLDDEAASFHASVASAFEVLAQHHGERIHRVDASQPVSQVQGDVQQLLLGRWPELLS